MSKAHNRELFLSAILVVPQTIHTYERTIECLREQTIVGNIEVVIVAPSRHEIELDESKLEGFHSWKVVEIGMIKSMGSANAAGVFQASAPIIALTEDHSYVQKNWAELFVNRHGERWAVVGPCMRNGNPKDFISWADFLQAYAEWMEPVSSGTIRHLPGHNSSYKKNVLLNFGAELETLMEAESILHGRLKKQGYELYLETSTFTTHLNFNSWSAFIPCRYYTGRQFAGTWSNGWHWYRRVLFSIASPAIPLWRLRNILKAAKKKKTGLFWLRVFPALFLELLLEGLGHFMGYLGGYGDSMAEVAKYEFNRVSFLQQN